jgi:UDP-glucose 4-epimerase
MKAVVFGGSGFVGSHVADALTKAGYEVVVFDKNKSSYLQEKQKMIIGDMMDPEQVRKAVEGSDFVYNFAGIADIDFAKDKPIDTIHTNVIGNANILEACRESGVKRYVFASSVYVFSNKGSFYRCSKQACELIIQEYQRRYNVPYTILRYGSLYGPRAKEDNFIYRAICDALKKGEVVREGDGEELREYINVHDAARLSVDILSKGYENEHVLITSTQRIKVKDMLTMIREMMDNKVKIRYAPVKDKAAVHYTITPFVFRPEIGKKLISNYYTDLGQGLLECIHDIYEKEVKSGK